MDGSPADRGGDPSDLTWAVYDKASASYVGSTSYLAVVMVHKRLEIGWTWYARRVWAGAVNPSCKRMLLAHGFDVLGLNRIELKADARNRALAAGDGAVRGEVRRHPPARTWCGPTESCATRRGSASSARSGPRCATGSDARLAALGAGAMTISKVGAVLALDLPRLRNLGRVHRTHQPGRRQLDQPERHGVLPRHPSGLVADGADGSKARLPEDRSTSGAAILACAVTDVLRWRGPRMGGAADVHARTRQLSPDSQVPIADLNDPRS